MICLIKRCEELLIKRSYNKVLNHVANGDDMVTCSWCVVAAAYLGGLAGTQWAHSTVSTSCSKHRAGYHSDVEPIS